MTIDRLDALTQMIRDELRHLLLHVDTRCPGCVAEQALDELRQLLDERIQERDEALAWLDENFFGEDDDPDEWQEKPVSEWLRFVRNWGDAAWHTAGMELERADAANSRLYAAVTRADTAEERVRELEATLESKCK